MPNYKRKPSIASLMTGLGIIILILTPFAFANSLVYGFGFLFVVCGMIFSILFGPKGNPSLIFFSIGLSLQSYFAYGQGDAFFSYFLGGLAVLCIFGFYLTFFHEGAYVFADSVIEQLKRDFSF